MLRGCSADTENAQGGAAKKTEHNPKGMMKAIFSVGVMRLAPCQPPLYRGAQISGAHRRSKGMAMNFSKALHLQGTQQRNSRIYQGILLPLPKLYAKNENQDFEEKDPLTPMQSTIELLLFTNKLNAANSDDKGENGEEIMNDSGEITLCQRDAEQHNIARLRISKDMSVHQIGESIQKAADTGQQRAYAEGFRHLAFNGIGGVIHNEKRAADVGISAGSKRP